MFHEKLKEIRAENGKTQKDLADYLNISPQSVSKWEKGEALPSLEYLPHIAKFYQCDINSLFEEDMEDSIDMNVESLINALKKLEKQLAALDRREPDDDEGEEYAKWQRRVEEVEEKMEKIKDKLEMGFDGIWRVVDMGFPKNLKKSECSREKYNEFFRIAKSVIVENEDETKLTSYLAKNELLRECVAHLCRLIITSNNASIAMIQRRMEVGYNLAGDIVTGLEQIGVVTPFEGGIHREIVYDQLWKLTPYFGIE